MKDERIISELLESYGMNEGISKSDVKFLKDKVAGVLAKEGAIYNKRNEFNKELIDKNIKRLKEKVEKAKKYGYKELSSLEDALSILQKGSKMLGPKDKVNVLNPHLEKGDGVYIGSD